MDTTTLTIGIDRLETIKQRMKDALRANTEQVEHADTTARYTFLSAADMARTLTPGRWAMIAALTGAGPLGVRELARRVERDVKGVHTDATALVQCGLVDRTEDGKLHFPYERVHVDFMLEAA